MLRTSLPGVLAAVVSAVLALSAVDGRAAANLNLSKSNVYRVVYAPAVTSTQAAAILADLDRLGKGASQSAVLGVLKQRGVKTGCGGGCVNHVKVVGGTTILLLESPADEAQALAVSDAGSPADKPSKGKSTK